MTDTKHSPDCGRVFARYDADCPGVVLRYLQTGDESIRAEARAEAWSEAREKQNRRLTSMLSRAIKEAQK